MNLRKLETNDTKHKNQQKLQTGCLSQSSFPAPSPDLLTAQMQTASATQHVRTSSFQVRAASSFRRAQRCSCGRSLGGSAKVQLVARTRKQSYIVAATPINAAAVEAPPKIEVIQQDTIEVLKVSLRKRRSMIYHACSIVISLSFRPACLQIQCRTALSAVSGQRSASPEWCD